MNFYVSASFRVNFSSPFMIYSFTQAFGGASHAFFAPYFSLVSTVKTLRRNNPTTGRVL